MRWTRRIALVLVLGGGCLQQGGVARADDAPAAPRPDALESGLSALRTRMQAKLKEADLLEKAGRLEEALAATREVERMYREGLAELQRLVASQPTAPAPRPPPPAGPDAPIPDDAVVEGPRPAAPGEAGGVPGASAQDAVLGGLTWLAAHQSPDGRWEAEGFGHWCRGAPNPGQRPDGTGQAAYDVGVTGLALCAFLGAGYTHRGDHVFAKVVRQGLGWLKGVQDPEGCFGPRATQHYFYNHAIASLAIVEAYGMTESPVFLGSAQKALDFIALCRNPYFGWRYGVKPGDNDTSATMWAIMALKSARLINEAAKQRGAAPPLTIDEEAFAGARSWLDKMTDPDSGRVGYVSRGTGPARPQELVDRFPAEKSESLTAAGMLMRIFFGEDPRTSPLIRKGADLLTRLPPTWNPQDGSIDMYYWYYGTLAMFQVGGDGWTRWEKAISTSILAHQRRDGDVCGALGSWDPIDPWGREGGRVYATALMTMCCEVYMRYDKVAGAK